MLLVQKMSIFSLFDFGQTKLVIVLLDDFLEKKETFLSIRKNNFFKSKNFFGPKKQNFSKSKKSTFPKGLAHAFGQKLPFFLYLDLVNIRLEIMVNYFEETKETFLTIKNRIFQSPKDRIFSKRAEPMLLAY